MPTSWRVLMVVLVVSLLASIAIGGYRLATTPTEILGDGFRYYRGGVGALEQGSATPR